MGLKWIIYFWVKTVSSTARLAIQKVKNKKRKKEEKARGAKQNSRNF
jgi:hypothetical protein